MYLLHPWFVVIHLQESAVQSVIVAVPFLVSTHCACPALAAQMFAPLLQPLNFPFYCCAYALFAPKRA